MELPRGRTAESSRPVGRLAKRAPGEAVKRASLWPGHSRESSSEQATQSIRQYHTVVVDSDNYVGRLIWARSEKSVKASLHLQERGIGKNKKKKRKCLVVIVPATWKFIKRAERFRDETTPEEACELLANWDLVSLAGYAGLHLEQENEPTPKVDTKVFCPYVPYIRNMATGMTWDYIGVTFSKMIKEIMKYKNDEHEKATQTLNWVEKDYEKEEMENKLFQLDTYIEELEGIICELKQQRDMALHECQLASEYSLKLMPLTPYSQETPRQVRVMTTSGDGSAASGPVLEKAYTRRYQSTRSFDKTSVMGQSDMGEIEFEEVGQEIFDKVKDHNEVHRSELGRALELLGFVCPREAWIDEIFTRISPQYSTIEIDDFVTFLRDYAAFRDEAYEATFQRCDQDGSGQIDSSELAEMLQELDVQPMSHVLEEVIEEVDKDQGGTLDLDEFKELLDLLHLREGFTRPEFEEFMGIFERYQRRRGEVDSKDLPSILNWLGFMWPKERIQQVLTQVKTGSRIDTHNFIVCMRKVRECELEMVQRVMQRHDADHSGTLDMREVVPVLKEIGYEMWDISAIFEAAEEAGVPTTELDLSAFWRLLLTYRKREGFCDIDLEQIDKAFDKEQKELLPALEAMSALRELGFTANFLVMESMLNKVDVDDTGSLDKSECSTFVAESQGSDVTVASVTVSDTADTGRQPPWSMLAALCLASAVEGIDSQLVPACQFALQKGGLMKLTDVAILSTVQMVLTNLAAPFWGVLADRGCLKRKHILMLGSLGEATAATLMAFVPANGFGMMIALRGMSGFFLASLRPIVNGIVADSTSDDRRGKMFSYVQSALLVGMCLTTLVAGNLANITIGEIPGWRALFVLGGVLAALIGAVIGVFMVEPPKQLDASAGKSGCNAVIEELCIMVHFLTIPTFLIMVVQGIFGTIPWTVMGNNLLFFKLSGLEDWQGSLLASEGTVVGVFGNLLGGFIADILAKRFGYHGRPLSAQISVAVGIPLIYLWFAGIPPGSDAAVFGVYFTVIACFSTLGNWAQSGTNFPILSDIVPPQNRSKVMAVECALENSIATLIGPLFVANLANAFGYEFGRNEGESRDIPSAVALGQAMAATICIPWCVTFLGYSFFHISYPADMRRLKAQLEKEKASAASGAVEVKEAEERETFNYKKAFWAAVPEGAQGLNEKEAAQAIKELGFRVRHQYLSLAAQVCAKSHRVDEPFLDQMAFVRVCSYHSRDLREVYKSNGGWTEGEVNHLQSVFNRYDIKHTGLIASKELVRMVEDLFPVLARDRKMRPELQRIMKEVLQETWSFQGLGFKDFLKLMRLFREFQDRERSKKEAQAIEDTGFNSSEVAQFRDFFLAAHAHSNSRSAGPGVEICFDQFWKMIFDITPLGDSLTAQLKNIFHQFTQKNPNAVRSKQRVEDADFPEFLLMMKHLLDINFAKIQEKTRSSRV
ncbi:Caltractin (20 kDa calcium-binding protein) (Centrin) [Durusdinium trenchii]|uniref:Caltractin (20 kDa calcium-binding protein) (Centrin) n=1 Tax=Durusdinium trenchii TaxID=1381693 RepID=A0ABP0PVI5_9DINO